MMIDDKNFEHLFEQVTLVRGTVGDRAKRHLCALSFAALLAGDAHNDRPETVSGLLRSYVIMLNDTMPDHQRQLLKPLVPLLLDTNDLSDPERLQYLKHITRAHILSRIEADFDMLSNSPSSIANFTRECFRGVIMIRIYLLQVHQSLSAKTIRDGMILASNVASLLCLCGKTAPIAQSDWYWAKAFEVLDCLCNIRDHSDHGCEPFRAVTPLHLVLRTQPSEPETLKFYDYLYPV